jgi:hypothetical protein
LGYKYFVTDPDPGWKNPDLGSGKNIPDPQHWEIVLICRYESINKLVVTYKNDGQNVTLTFFNWCGKVIVYLHGFAWLTAALGPLLTLHLHQGFPAVHLINTKGVLHLKANDYQ